MQLKNFELVNAEGLKGLTYKGKYIPFEKLTDDLAEKLEGKTHVLKRVSETPAQVPAPLALAEATSSPAAAEEAPSTPARRPRGN